MYQFQIIATISRKPKNNEELYKISVIENYDIEGMFKYEVEEIGRETGVYLGFERFELEKDKPLIIVFSTKISGDMLKSMKKSVKKLKNILKEKLGCASIKINIEELTKGQSMTAYINPVLKVIKVYYEMELRNIFVAAALEVFKAKNVYVSVSDVSKYGYTDYFCIEASPIPTTATDEEWRSAVIVVMKILMRDFQIPSVSIIFVEGDIRETVEIERSDDTIKY